MRRFPKSFESFSELKTSSSLADKGNISASGKLNYQWTIERRWPYSKPIDPESEMRLVIRRTSSQKFILQEMSLRNW